MDWGRITFIILVFLCMVILIINPISAAQFDNTKEFDKDIGKYGKVKIKNLFGLGATITELELKENTDTCGTICSAETEIIMYEDGVLIDDIRFMTLKEDESWAQQPIRSYQFYIKTRENEIEVDDFKNICKEREVTSHNGTYIEQYDCKKEKVGTHKEKEPLWKLYRLGDEVEAGTYYVKLEGKKKPTRTVDWQITSQGKLIDEWAVWKGSDTLGLGLMQYYSFSEGTGTWANNSVNLAGHPGKLMNTPTWVSGKIGSGLDFNRGSSEFVNVSENIVYTNRNFTASFWIKLDDTSNQYNRLLSHKDAFWVQYRNDGTHYLDFNWEGVLQSTTIVESEWTNTWKHVVVWYNKSAIKTYINGTLATSQITGGNMAGNQGLQIGASEDGLNTVPGIMDEIGIWNRSLSLAEITELYNSGNGISFDGSLAVTLNSPADDSISTTNNVTFNCSATTQVGATIANLSLWTNMSGSWVLNETEDFPTAGGLREFYDGVHTCNIGMPTTFAGAQGMSFTIGGDGTDGDFTLGNVSMYLKPGGAGVFNFTIWDTTGTPPLGTINNRLGSALLTVAGAGERYYNVSFADQNIEMTNGSQYVVSVFASTDTGGNVCAEAPNNYVHGRRFNGLSADVEDLSFKIYGQQGQRSVTSTFNKNISSTFDWTCRAFDSDGDSEWASSNYTIGVDASAPQITINLPTGLSDFGYVGKTENLNWSITDANLDTIWYNYNGTNLTLNGAINKTTFTLKTSPYNLTLYANDSVGNINSSYISWTYKIFNNSETYNVTTYETSTETFSINITANSSLTGVNLIYQGTSYAATQSGTVWSKVLQIPTGSANKVFNWSFTYAGDTLSSQSNTQTVNLTVFALCNATYAVPFLNFTFKDESDDSVIQNGTIPSSTFRYWLGDGTVNKTLNFINNTANPAYAFCGSPPDRTLNVDYQIQYEDAEGDYIQRLLNPDTLTFSNATTNTTLYLLKSTDGSYVNIQVINQAEQSIEGAVVIGTRVIGGSTVTVASGTTDAAGSVTFFLDGDFSHTFTVTATGYDDYTTSLFPTESNYILTLGESVSPANDYNQQISVDIHPYNITLTNDTAYDFKMILTSDYWTVTKFGFVLYNSSGSNVGSAILSANGGTASTNYNVGNTSQHLSMNYYWVIEGNYTNSTRVWHILSASGTDWSIKNFFDDFTTYTTGGLFGMGDFGKGIVVFLIVFLFVGIMSYKFGLVSPAGVASLAFGLILFFDVGLGIIPGPKFGSGLTSAVPNFLTIFTGIILAGILFREVYR